MGKLEEQRKVFLHKEASIIFEGNLYDYLTIREQVNDIKMRLENGLFGLVEAVVIGLERNVQFVSGMIALLELNIPFIPIDIHQPQDRMKNMLTKVNAMHVLTTRKMEAFFDFIPKHIILDEEEKEESEKDMFKCANEDIAYILFTSGSTGTPKGAAIKRSGLINFIDGMSEVIDFSPQKVIGSFTNVSFDIFILETILSLNKGLCVILATDDERINPKQIIKMIKKYSIQMVQFTPSNMKMIQMYDGKFSCLKDISEIMIGGEQFPPRLLKDLQEVVKGRIYNMYGPIEATVWTTVADLTEEEIVHIGKPIRNVGVYVLDETLEPVGEGKIGEICIVGEGLAQGYYHDDKLSAESFKELQGSMLYCTGDMGRYNKNGQLECLGRKDFQIKLNGNRIELEDIDANLFGFPDVDDVVTCFVKNEDSQFLVAFYISKRDIREDEWRGFAKKVLPSYMIPTFFVRIKEFCYTSSMKKDRIAIVDKYWNSQSVGFKNTKLLAGSKKGNLFDIIIGFIAEVLAEKGEVEFDVQIDEKTYLKDTALDSLDFIKLVVKMETVFNIEFDDVFMGSFDELCVYDVKKYIEEKGTVKI